MAYRIRNLSQQLILIHWEKTPNDQEREQFVKDVQHLLEAAENKLYVISDLRKGRISDLQTLRRLIEILQHKNYAGGTSFSSDVRTKLIAGVFAKLADTQNVRDKDCETLEEAMGFLESLSPGITKDIDWESVLLA